MEISVKCPQCKSTYSFQEEPVSGRLRFPVQCTNCGTDGTSTANEFIRKSLSGELEQERQKNNVWWKKIGRRRDDDETTVQADAIPREPGAVRTGLGVTGACIGGILGLLLWYFVGIYTGREIGFVAWAVGILAGVGTRLFVRNGTFAMASTAALCAFLAIMGGQVLTMKTIYEKVMGEVFKGSYDKAMVYAKDAAAAKTDDDIRTLLKKYPAAMLTFREDEDRSGKPQDAKLLRLGYTFMAFGEDDEDELSMNDFLDDMDVEPMSADEIGRYRAEDIPMLAEFAKGKPSRAQFEGTIKTSVFKDTSLNEMVVQSWSPYQLLWLVLGVCSAYKLAYNRSETEDV